MPVIIQQISMIEPSSSVKIILIPTLCMRHGSWVWEGRATRSQDLLVPDGYHEMLSGPPCRAALLRALIAVTLIRRSPYILGIMGY